MNENVSDLILKHLKGQLSENDEAVLDLWLEESTENRALFEELVDEEKLNEKLQRYNSVRKDILWKKTLKNIASNEEYAHINPFKRSVSWYQVFAAASLLIFVSIISYVSLNHILKPQVEEYGEIEISAGSNKAILTLADGTTVSLDGKNDGRIAEEVGMEIRKTADGQIVYEVDSKDGAGSKISTLFSKGEKIVKYNQISTPRGGQYQIVLADGTKVWLNAASSLRYPLEFTNNERSVELVGEAYFEVNRQQTNKGENVPFFVKTSTQTVEVLGTHFNINSYEDEASVKTTLIEGSVRVSLNTSDGTAISDKNTGVLLKPNQQSVILESQIAVVPVDVEEAIAWKEGYYKFNSEDLGSIMRNISRWYDVEIVFQGNAATVKFGGKISRKESISKVLEIIGETGNVQFKIENGTAEQGKRIIVMPAAVNSL